jgi:hypothetical protein
MQACHRAKIVLNSLTYSQNKNGAQQKQNIFCLIFAKRKSLILIGSFFAPDSGKRRKPAWRLVFFVSRGACSQSYPQFVWID